MKIQYHNYSDENDHGYQYHHGIVNMCLNAYNVEKYKLKSFIRGYFYC